MSKIYKVGVVGTGFIGTANIEAIRRIGNAEVVAVADSMTGKDRAATFGIPAAYDDYKEMIAKENLDVIHICTPNHLHCEVALYAMDHGCNVVCEKPMTTTLEEAQKMAEKAKETGLMNGVDYHNRFYPMAREMRKMIEDGELGTIHAFVGQYLQDWLLMETDFNWRILSSQSGKTRAVSDIGSHWMDLAESATGLKIVEVFADFKILHDKRKKAKVAVDTFQTAELKEGDYELIEVDTEDHANILMHFDNGAVGSLVVSQVMAGRKAMLSMNIGGDKKSVTWTTDSCNDLWVGSRVERNQIFEKDPGMMHPDAASAAGFPGGHAEGFPDAMKMNFKAMYDSIANRDKIEYATFADGLHQMELCEAVYKSAHSQKWEKV